MLLPPLPRIPLKGLMLKVDEVRRITAAIIWASVTVMIREDCKLRQ